MVYSFYWSTNDDKLHHFTQIQRNANRQLLKSALADLRVQCRLSQIKLAGCSALEKTGNKVFVIFARKHEAMDILLSTLSRLVTFP